MRRYLRTIFLWTLILAIPVQGLASALKSSCVMERSSTHHSQAVSEHGEEQAVVVAKSADVGNQAFVPGGSPPCHDENCDNDAHQNTRLAVPAALAV
jgi:hypothetical protein